MLGGRLWKVFLCFRAQKVLICHCMQLIAEKCHIQVSHDIRYGQSAIHNVSYFQIQRSRRYHLQTFHFFLTIIAKEKESCTTLQLLKCLCTTERKCCTCMNFFPIRSLFTDNFPTRWSKKKTFTIIPVLWGWFNFLIWQILWNADIASVLAVVLDPGVILYVPLYEDFVHAGINVVALFGPWYDVPGIERACDHVFAKVVLKEEEKDSNFFFIGIINDNICRKSSQFK